MKKYLVHSIKVVLAGLCLGLGLMAYHSRAAVLYWDPQANNAQNPYTGDMTGSWASPFWSPLYNGQATPVTFTNGDAACFSVSAGIGTPPFTVQMNNNQTVAGIFDGSLNPNSCNVTIYGTGIMTLPSGLNAFSLFNASDGSIAILTISNTIAGSGIFNPQENGQIYLYGANTWTGGTSLGYSGNAWEGTVYFNTTNAFGTGSINVSNCLGGALISTASSALTITNPFLFPKNVAAKLSIVGDSAPLTFTGPWTYNATCTLNLGTTNDLGNDIFASGVISGGSGMVLTNSSTNAASLTLSGVDTYTGPTTIYSNVTLTVAGAGKLGNGSYGGAFTDAAGATFVYGSSSGQTLSGTLSGAGAFDLAATPSTSLTISGTANTFTGLFTITGGTFAINADGSLGAVPGSVVADAITLDGGPGANLRANANNITINANRGITLGANGGAIQVAGNDTCTYNGVISGSGQFQDGVNASVGLGVLVLGGVETYTNTTVLAAGTLRLASTASIGNSAGIVISNTPTLDVSAENPFDLSTTNTITVIGNTAADAPATILGALGGVVDFGSQTVTLSFNPLTNGDAIHMPLVVSQSTLELDGNTIDVTNAAGSTLDIGNYALIQCTNGFNITSALTLNYAGTLAPNTTASLTVISNVLVMQVLPAAGYANSQFINQAPYPGQTAVFGTPTVNVGGTIAGAGAAEQGETVTIAIPSGSYTTTISDNAGDFSLALPVNTLAVGSYPVSYSYAGDGTLGPANDTSTTLTITKAAVTVTANDQTKVYGQTLTSGAGQTAFSASGLQNSDTIGTVSLAFNGSPAGNTILAGTNTYTITPSAATGGTFSAGNYTLSYVAGTLTVNPLPVGLTGTRVYDGTATAIYSILSITNKVVSTDTVSLATGSVTLASPAGGAEPIISGGTLTLSGARDTNYTTIGAIGAVTVTVNSSQTNIVFSTANNAMTMSWPLDHTGWELQAQTNSLAVGISNNWVDVTGSTTTNQVVVPIDLSNGSVFYRLVYPPQ